MTGRSVLLLGSLAAIAACSDTGAASRGPGAPVLADTALPAVSAEQARAAQLLSLAGGGAAPARSDYAGSLECTAALGLLMNTIADSPLLDDTQVAALRQAHGLFRSRALEAGSAEGKAAREVSADLERAAADAGDDSAASSRKALGCIRGLAGEAQRAAGGS